MKFSLGIEIKRSLAWMIGVGLKDFVRLLKALFVLFCFIEFLREM